jgi:hypothetical protein
MHICALHFSMQCSYAIAVVSFSPTNATFSCNLYILLLMIHSCLAEAVGSFDGNTTHTAVVFTVDGVLLSSQEGGVLMGTIRSNVTLTSGESPSLKNVIRYVYERNVPEMSYSLSLHC